PRTRSTRAPDAPTSPARIPSPAPRPPTGRSCASGSAPTPARPP
ncbi:MAG: hypothetical protein AVDCRST_MAG54-79, partial [uncultured Actinomycetospora sp.]